MIASSLKEGQEEQDGADEIVDLLLKKGADVDIKSEFSPALALSSLLFFCVWGRRGEEGEKGGVGRG